MESFFDDPSYERYLDLPDSVKYALHDLPIVKKSEEYKKLLKAFLFSYRKEEEKRIFDVCLKALKPGTWVEIFSDIYVEEKKPLLFFIRRNDYGDSYEYKCPQFLGDENLYLSTIHDDTGRMRFNEIIKYAVVGDVIITLTCTQDPKAIYTKKRGFIRNSDEKSVEIPDVYSQDVYFADFIYKYGFYIGNLEYQNYIYNRNLHFIFNEYKSTMLETKLKDVVFDSVVNPVELFITMEAGDFGTIVPLTSTSPIEIGIGTGIEFRFKEGADVYRIQHDSYYQFTVVRKNDKHFLRINGYYQKVCQKDGIYIDFDFIIDSLTNIYCYLGGKL